MVKLGCDELRDALKGKKLALMMNHSSLDNEGRNLIDTIATDWGCDVRMLFGMEHGVRGNMSKGFDELAGKDERTGIPLECLYKFPDNRPPAELLRTVDAAVFSAQDAGCRCYTYAPWMCYLMDAAAQAGCEVIVLDRPNPIGGEAVEGAYIDPSQYGLIGVFPYTLRHGLTIGEMARMYNDVMHVGADLRVIPMEGYRREMFYADTGLLWTPASPNIPTPETFVPYCGMVLFENVSVSYGRGTTAPFYYCGAPFVDGRWLADRMNAQKLPGVRFVEAHWQPLFNNCADEDCEGVFINVTDPRAYRSAECAVRLLFALTERYADRLTWNESYMHTESGTTLLYDTLTGRRPGDADTVLRTWEADAADFEKKRAPYLLY
ncbi:MAG: DUF1343 domain-containing protein [Clostridiaceae bacterium]|nr:DUF1343 domain-containing protein [Clostridiaceae bacterium]